MEIFNNSSQEHNKIFGYGADHKGSSELLEDTIEEYGDRDVLDKSTGELIKKTK